MDAWYELDYCKVDGRGQKNWTEWRSTLAVLFEAKKLYRHEHYYDSCPVLTGSGPSLPVILIPFTSLR